MLLARHRRAIDYFEKYVVTEKDIEKEIEEAKHSLETGRRELQIKEAGKFVYKDQIDMLRKKDSPACPTCNRDFENKSEIEELIQVEQVSFCILYLSSH